MHGPPSSTLPFPTLSFIISYPIVFYPTLRYSADVIEFLPLRSDPNSKGRAPMIWFRIAGVTNDSVAATMLYNSIVRTINIVTMLKNTSSVKEHKMRIQV